MANIPLKTLAFSDLIDNVYTVPQVDDTLTQTGYAADAKVTGDEVFALKADLSDKDALTVGTAKQLVGDKFTEDKVPYLFRQSGGGLTVGNREYLDAIVGGTVAWNQQLDPSKGASSTTAGNVTITNNGDGSYTFNGTCNANASFLVWSQMPAVNGHIYLFTGYKKEGSNTGFFGYNGVSIDKGNGGIKASTADKINVRVDLRSGDVYTNLTMKFNVFDLTAMFGTEIADYIYALEQANAGDGVAFFKKLFPNDYYEYNPGELISVSGVSAHETVGFNQWNEEWKVIGNHIGSKNPIPCMPNTAYYMKTSAEPSNGLKFWTKDMVQTGSTRYNGGLFTTPADCHFMTFEIASAYGTVYKNDICINISDPKRNGTYEPYIKRSYPLDSTLTLRGVPKLVDGKIQYDGDRYLPDGTVQRRYGVVDLGTLTWTNGASLKLFFSTGLKDLIRKVSTNAEVADWIFAPNFTPISYNSITASTAGRICVAASGSIGICDGNTYESVNAFKAAMSGVMLIYELATPTIETAEPYRSDQLLDTGGTEEFISTGIVPVGHETRYPEDLVKKLESLPWDMSMIAPVETGTTASQAYAVGKYFILNDQFCKAKTAIASGATFTLNTNYEVTTVADELYTALH